MYMPVLMADAPALPAAGSKLHMVAAGHMPEGSLLGLLGFSRVPNGGASVLVATRMLARASAVGIAPKPPGKQEQGGTLFINAVSTQDDHQWSSPFRHCPWLGMAKLTTAISIDSPPSMGDVSMLHWWVANSRQTTLLLAFSLCHPLLAAIRFLSDAC